MNHATPIMRNFADYLIARESDSEWPAFNYPLTENQATLGIVEKLRPQLEELMGETGFRALLMNALAYSKDELPGWSEARINLDGGFQGFEQTLAETDPDKLFNGGAVVLAWFLRLLTSSIGELLTIQLVLEVWPDLAVNDRFSNAGESWEEATDVSHLRHFAKCYGN